MKGYYLFAPVEPACVGPQSGVERKVRAQHKALARHLNCELVILDPMKYTQSPAERIIRRLPGTAAWRKWDYKGEFDDADFLYIRQVYHDAAFVRWLRDLKRANPRVKIIYEIPTWPYLTETKISLSSLPFALKERRNGPRAAELCDRIVTFYGQEEIWGVPCIRLLNGYDFDQVILPHRKPWDTVHIISVAVNAFWHGYDRILEGLGRYYENGGTENIHYHLVGDILPEYEALVEKYDLSGHVTLHGRLYGEALAELYRLCTLGIDILGGHRKDYPVSSTLKSREYGAWGLPLVTSSPVDFMEPDCPWQHLVPYDDSPVDIEAMLRWYHETYARNDADAVAKAIRNFAYGHCHMPITMEPVARWLLEASK